jgi:hypothetical protein
VIAIEIETTKIECGFHGSPGHSTLPPPDNSKHLVVTPRTRRAHSVITTRSERGVHVNFQDLELTQLACSLDGEPSRASSRRAGDVRATSGVMIT